jgi:hypothetical protein
MTNNSQTAADAAFNDAWDQYKSAIERLDAGDIRDACGKAWNATRAATRAAALSHGEDPQNTNHISSWIRRMGRGSAGFELMPLMFGARARFLHQEACYDGHIDDPDIPDLIYGTADYIRQAQRLASL